MESESLARRRIIVDGSNLATEGRTLPSLGQLNEAIETFLEEYRGFTPEDVTVVVDASFGHRIDPSEVQAFEQAIEHGEMVSPPAGAVGRGDGFILRIAEKSGALVLSNDSFQEFHAERPWLFEQGRLIGGKPVPGVGWVFTPRTPVRGPRSRSVTAQSKRESQAAGGAEAVADDLFEESGQPADGEATTTATTGPRRRRRSSKAGAPAEPAPVTSDAADADDAYEGVGVRTAKATKATTTAKTTKAVKATKAGKATKADNVVKAVKATKAGKASGATKATKAVKATSAVTATAGDLEDDGAPAKVAKKGTRVKKATGVKKAATATKAVRGTRAASAEEVIPDPAASPIRDVPLSQALNNAMTFLTFVADHPVASTFDGEVVSFTSHGAHVDVAGMLCHIPLRYLGDPAPQKARSVLTKGEVRAFELVSLDAPRRRAELSLPGLAD
jgi:hypothetical protein